MDLLMAYDPVLMTADLARDGAGIALDAGLETAIVLSLFTDRRARSDDALPDAGGGDRRGWWGDMLPPAEGDRVGSRLWLLAREKQLPEVLARARDYAREALQWLIDDGVAAQIDVAAEIARPGVLGLAITVHRPTGAATVHRYSYAWDAHV